MESESRLEDLLAQDIGVADPNLLLIGRQVPTAHGKFIDLLAIDANGKLVVLELKRDRTPREVVAQLLDYGSWVRSLEDDDIAAIFECFLQKHVPEHAGSSLDEAFCANFKTTSMPESLNKASPRGSLTITAVRTTRRGCPPCASSSERRRITGWLSCP